MSKESNTSKTSGEEFVKFFTARLYFVEMDSD